MALRVAVVDDRADVLTGRTAWLEAAGHQVVALSFEAALGRRAGWGRFDRIVLDGRDDSHEPVVFGASGIPDRFLGPRVAAHIRAHDDGGAPVIILVSIYVRTHEELALRCQQSGVDYAFDLRDIVTPAAFVAIVENPHEWGWSGVTSAAGDDDSVAIPAVIDELEASPAGAHIVTGTSVGTAYERRVLRERLEQLMGLAEKRSPAGRRRHPRSGELRPIVRRFLGLDERHGPDS